MPDFRKLYVGQRNQLRKATDIQRQRAEEKLAAEQAVKDAKAARKKAIEEFKERKKLLAIRPKREQMRSVSSYPPRIVDGRHFCYRCFVEFDPESVTHELKDTKRAKYTYCSLKCQRQWSTFVSKSRYPEDYYRAGMTLETCPICSGVVSINYNNSVEKHIATHHPYYDEYKRLVERLGYGG